jgi:chemotaxis regulatin CheY-phosphate phosphatase CheZ
MAAPRKVFRIEETPAARVAAGGARASERHTEVMQAQASLEQQALERQVLERQVLEHQAFQQQALQQQVLQEQVLQELAALRSAFAAPNPQAAKPDISGAATGRLTSELHLIAGRLTGNGVNNGDDAGTATVPLTRIANELLAVTSGTEQATQKILAAAEEIDQLANNLSAALRGKIEQGLAQDIQDLVIRIFEACNFQDLNGQRVSKVMTTLKFVEDHITSVLDQIKNMSARPSGEAAQYLHGPRLDADGGHVSQTDIDAIFDT